MIPLARSCSHPASKSSSPLYWCTTSNYAKSHSQILLQKAKAPRARDSALLPMREACSAVLRKTRWRWIQFRYSPVVLDFSFLLSRFQLFLLCDQLNFSGRTRAVSYFAIHTPRDVMKLTSSMCWVAGFCLALLLSPTRVQAQYSWNNGSGGSWMDPNSWTPQGGPPKFPGDTATITLFSFMTISLGTPLEISSFTFNSPFCNLTGGTLVLDSGFNWNAGALLGPVRIGCNGDSEFN